MLTQLKIWGMDAGGDGVLFEKGIGDYDGERFKPFLENVEVPSSKAHSLAEQTSGIAAVRAGDESAIFFVRENGSISLTSSTGGINGDNPSVKVGDLTDDDAVQIANLTNEPLDVQVFYFYQE